MKYKLIVNKELEESIVITVHEKTELIEEIEKLINENNLNLIGYDEDEFTPLKIEEIYAFFSNNGKIYASTINKTYLLKERIYQLEKLAPSFIKINQGCLIDPNKILRFETKISGSIRIVMKNNFSDYIARREMKNVKRRLGI